MASTVQVEVERETAANRRTVTYTVPCTEPATVYGLLRRIYEEQDSTLAFRAYRCYQGICTSCLVSLNGKTVKSCSIVVEPGSRIQVGPAPGYEIIADLAVDFSRRQQGGTGDED